MSQYLRLIAFILASILYSQPSFALAKFGHSVVCQLAYEHLSSTKQTKINQLLQLTPTSHKIIINQYNHHSKDSPLTFAKTCTWADAIKKQKKLTQYKQYSAWHYLNVSRDMSQITSPVCTNNCLPQAILSHQKQLQTNTSSWESTQALMFLGHWLADIHQPLHVSYASDLGGNKIRFKNKHYGCKNLHTYWDSCLIKQAKKSQKQWVSYLSTQWHTITVQPFAKQHVWQWADESYQLVRNPRFQYCELTTVNSNKSICRKPSQNIQLADDYSQHYLPIMEQQLLKAAKRLTLLLEQSL